MKRLLVLLCAASLAARVAVGQDEHNLLKQGAEAYDLAEYPRAKPLLIQGLNPALGPRDSLWIEGVHRLAHILVEQEHDSLAAVWVRWAIRTTPTLRPDTLNFPPAVQDVFAAAQAFVLRGKPDDTVPAMSWEWNAGAGDSVAGDVRVPRGAQASAFIDGPGLITAGETRRLAPGSYRITLGTPGRAPISVTREVLPGVSTVLPARSAIPAAATAPPICFHASRSNHVAMQLELALAHWNNGVLDSAVAAFAAASSADPFLALDSACAGLPVASAFRAARRATPSVALRAADTTLDPTTARWGVALAVGRPGAVTVRLSRVDSSHTEWQVATPQVDSTSALSVSLTDPDHRRLPFGTYRLRATYASADAKADALLTFEIVAPDTLPHEPPPPPSAYRDEFLPGPHPLSSLLKGMALGAAVAAIPMVLGHEAFQNTGREERAMVIGVTAAVAGVAGFVMGRHQVPSPDNIAYNQALRKSWEDSNSAVTQANSLRRDGSQVRVRVLTQ